MWVSTAPFNSHSANVIGFLFLGELVKSTPNIFIGQIVETKNRYVPLTNLYFVHAQVYFYQRAPSDPHIEI
ncbi:uncharacterized protein METZ01_LOCUS58803, partial [marine metagenome]